ncbi:unnamed protein product [Protopolystoma xenopodis]|uniref:Beta-mannosidase n=1 Tax=Protopolystoma xenopodis TaxID=117903 RepID=A0A448WNW9_9PLAT|nr:unnamed protein product [Protopolystoma xenopodis]
MLFIYITASKFSYMYLTQINQAMAYKAHINRLMRHRCRLIGLNSTDPGSISGTGLSMGAMYWQLNDVWSAPTWSTLDATGQWKMAHYQVRGSGLPRYKLTSPIRSN